MSKGVDDNGCYGSFDVHELDDEELPSKRPVNLAEVRARKKADSFWNDPCWTDELPSE